MILRPFNVNAIRFSRKFSTTKTNNFDLVIVGGGIIGAATGRTLASRYGPALRMAILEKDAIAAHQSGHNSGVIHAGAYYKPGTLKAKLCVEGSQLAHKYCDEHGIPYKKIGKLIVATKQSEVSRLKDLFRRGQENGVKGLELLEFGQIKYKEPECNNGKLAIWSPETGIVDWGQVTRAFAKEFITLGPANKILTGFSVNSIEHKPESPAAGPDEYPILITSDHEVKVRARYVVTAAGLYSDRIAMLTGCDPYPKIIPFRGEYLILSRDKRHLVSTNIYPVPDPSLPFLGVHFTPRMNGDVWLGPNAVLAAAREGYNSKIFNRNDLVDSLTSPGLQKLIFKHLFFGLSELRASLNPQIQIKRLRRYIPSLTVHDVVRGPSGVRAQAIDRNGNLVDDFVFNTPTDFSGPNRNEVSQRVIHVRNAPSPAATSSLAIANVIVDKINEHFNL